MFFHRPFSIYSYTNWLLYSPASGNKTMQSFISLAAQASENLSPGQASGSGSGTQNNPSGSNGGNGGSGGNSPSGTTGGNLPISPSGSSPAQQSANVASSFSSQSFFGLGAAAIAAFAML
jgi:hypothetical protein